MRFSILLVLALLLNINPEIYANLDLSQKARILYNQARFTEAINLYQEIINYNPQDSKAYLNLAYLYKDLVEYKQAIEVVQKALKFSNDNRLKMLLVRLYYLDAKPRQAISRLRQLSSSYSNDPEFLFYLGLCYEDIGKLTEAEASYLDVLKLKPNHVLAYLKLGNIYYQRQRLKEATEIYQKVITLDPSILEGRSKLAECFMKLEEFSCAYKEYAKCVAIEPDNQLFKKNLEKSKAKLGEDFFQKDKILTSQRRRIKSIRVEASPYALSASQVRVSITKIQQSIEFKCGSSFQIIDQQSNESLFEGEKESIYFLVFNKKTGIQLKDSQENVILAGLDKPFLIKNKSEDSVITIFDLFFGEGNFWAGWHDQQYRGEIEVLLGNDGFQLINLVNLEEYLYSVLPSEMPVNWPEQALCAQAIAARTWAVSNKARHKYQGFNFCSSVHCQVYKGARAETQVTNQAVDDTAGLILVGSQSQPIDIFYSNNCGGCTQEGVVDVLSLEFHFPLSPLELEEWLMDEPDAFCNLKKERSANFRWVRYYKQEQLQAMLDKSNIDIGEILKIIPQKRAKSSHLVSIKIEGIKDTQVIEGQNNIREILGSLLSSAFKIETKFNPENQPAEFIFYGGGFGHGRGMCQTGAKGMALQGHSYLEIMKHYFPDAQVKKIY